MANPARKPPTGTEHPESAVDILRRLEPVLTRITDDLGDVKAEQKEQRKDIAKLQQDVAEMKGRLTGIEGQLRQIPTVWTISALIFTIFGASFALIRYAMGH